MVCCAVVGARIQVLDFSTWEFARANRRPFAWGGVMSVEASPQLSADYVFRLRNSVGVGVLTSRLVAS